MKIKDLREMPLSSGRLAYRPLSRRDTPLILRWRSNPDIYRYYRNPVPLTPDSHAKWLAAYWKDTTKAEYILIHKEARRPIGFVGITLRATEDAELGYTIAEFGGQGLATEAIGALVGALAARGIVRFWLEIHMNNRPSIRVAHKCGFEPYGRNGDFYIMRMEHDGLPISPILSLV